MKLRDPVCGMEITWAEAVALEHVGPLVVYFCCDGCAKRFRRDPLKQVDIPAWLGPGSPELRSGVCPHADPLPSSDRRPAFRSLRRAAVPRLGSRALDEVDALVDRCWRQRLGPDAEDRHRTRRIERLLLYRCTLVAPTDLAESDRQLMSEVVRLRSRRKDDGDRVRRELEALPEALGTAVLQLDIGPLETVRIYQDLEAALQETTKWVFKRPGDRIRRDG